MRFGKFAAHEHVLFYPPNEITLVDGFVSAGSWEGLELGYLRIIVPDRNLIYMVPMADVIKCGTFECLGEHDETV